MMRKYTIKLIFLVLTFLLFTFPQAIFAQGSTPSPTETPIAPSLPAIISPTSPLFTDLLVSNMFHSFSCLASGASTIGQPCLNYQFSKNAQGNLQGVPVLSQVNLSGGILGGTTSLIGILYDDPPVRTAHYLASVGQGLGIVKEANAQVIGSGANVLSPILTLWQVSRNISYLIMIIIFIVIGVMIMLRNKINPQTVITAQAALPGLVIGLIMITFSYFLAGVITDTSFLGTNIVGAYFSTVKKESPANLVEDLKGQSSLKVFSEYTGIVSIGWAKDAVDSILDQIPFGTQVTLRSIASLVAAQFMLPIGGLAGGQGQVIAGLASTLFVNLSPDGVIGTVLHMMAIVILIYAMLRLLFRLIQSYLQIIFLTISAPFQFLAASLPGRQGIATGWVFSLLGHALAFPAVIAVFYFVSFILGSYNPSSVFKTSDAGPVYYNFVPEVRAANGIDVIGDQTLPLFGGMKLEFVRILIAFGALVALPGIPDVIQRLVGRASEAGQILGQEYSKSVGGGRGYYSQGAGAPGQFAGQVGNLKDQPWRHFEEKDGRSVWKERWDAQPGLGHPTMGAWSRMKYGSWGQGIGNLWGKIRGKGGGGH